MNDPNRRLAVRFMRAWNGSTIMDQLDLSPPGAPPPMGADYPDVFSAINWMMVLAAPALFRTLGRVPVREHVAKLVDVYAAYVARGDTLMGPPELEPQRHEQRLAAVERLRPLLVAWAPPDLPAEITEAAREVLRAEGIAEPAGGWSALENEGPDPLHDVLSWPEGIPLITRGLQAQAADLDAANGQGSDEGLSFFEMMKKRAPDALEALNEYARANAWMFVLATPQLFRRLTRVPTREHLLAQLDRALTGPREPAHGPFPRPSPVDREHREGLSRRLRTLLERWTPPELSAEITEATRGFLIADGGSPPEGGWDALEYEEFESLDQTLWPEEPLTAPAGAP